MIEKEELLSLLPHRGRMLLLSRIKKYNLKERTLEAEYDISEDCLFYDPAAQGVPVWAGFEFMAQAISSLIGLRDRELGVKSKMGLILSVSSMNITLPFFRTGSTAAIKVKEINRMDLVYTFKGEIFPGCSNGPEAESVLEGKITVTEIDEEQARALKEGDSIEHG